MVGLLVLMGVAEATCSFVLADGPLVENIRLDGSGWTRRSIDYDPADGAGGTTTEVLAFTGIGAEWPGVEAGDQPYLEIEFSDMLLTTGMPYREITISVGHGRAPRAVRSPTAAWGVGGTLSPAVRSKAFHTSAPGTLDGWKYVMASDDADAQGGLTLDCVYLRLEVPELSDGVPLVGPQDLVLDQVVVEVRTPGDTRADRSAVEFGRYPIVHTWGLPTEGGTLGFTVRGAPDESPVAAAFGELGAGPCPAALDGECLDVTAIRGMVASETSVFGSWIAELAVPPGVRAGDRIDLQVVVDDPDLGPTKTPVVTTIVR